MKKIIALLVALGLVTGFAAFAEGDKKAEKKAEVAADAKDLELTGKIVKEEKASKKEGAEKHVFFMLETADGKVMLPKGKDDATNPEKFLDKTVTVKGKGVTKEKEGKKMTRITEITSITEAAAK
ncbi:MAG TPA: hypothetical protein DET40_20355 [Lentisphaeria bacterium]|nr:MAG: hypothetical protein A2X45_16410 [Lentisphaerae bacterium GWF2_50_93]HCE45904.1 hypothetical protein [Lentisphaeria bacterium]